MKSPKPLALKITKGLIYLLVTIGIVYTAYQGITQISESQVTFEHFRWGWLPWACLFYFASMIICWVYWHIVLKGLGQHPQLWDSFRAFILGQLGKYFPGKALVVIVRTSIISGPKVQPAVAATSVFIETLTYMAVGAGIASILMIFCIEVGFWLILLGLGAIVAAGLPIAPPVLRFLVRLLRIDRMSPKLGTAIENLQTKTSLIGWLMLPFSWLFVGLSLWATIQLIAVGTVPFEQVPRLTACVGLAVVAGFLSMTPGGLGVREIVLVAILAPIDPAFNSATTLVVAVTLRLVWLVTELLLTIILKSIGWATNSSPHPIIEPKSLGPESPATPSPTEE
jgi:uncharacterized membrane protein YbhN (UPF0104 family)